MGVFKNDLMCRNILLNHISIMNFYEKSYSYDMIQK